MALKQKQRSAASTAAYALSHLGLLYAYRFLRSLGNSRVAILVYHRVGDYVNPWSSMTPVKTRDFENQIEYLSKAYEILPLDKLVQHIREGKVLPKKAVSITFDDGYKDNYLYAYPILKKYNVPATVYLTTGLIDTGDIRSGDKVRYVLWNTPLERVELDELGSYSLKSDIDRLEAISRITGMLRKIFEERKNHLVGKLVDMAGVDIPASLGKEDFLCWEEIREMSNNGIVFGAHSVTHPVLTKLPLEQAKREIIRSKTDIEEKIGQVVTGFSYPYGELGEFNPDLIRFVKESGFTYAVTGISGMITSRAELYELRRIGVRPWGNFDIFKLSLFGLYPDLEAVLNRVRRSS